MMLWDECLAGNLDAWAEMQKYNSHDVLSTEDVYNAIQHWDQSVRFDVYLSGKGSVCNCGSTNLERRGFHYNKVGKYHKYRCRDCGSWHRGQQNLIPKDVKNTRLKTI